MKLKPNPDRLVNGEPLKVRDTISRVHLRTEGEERPK